MKTYKHLYDDFISDDSIRESVLKASLGKRNRKSVKPVVEHLEEFIPIIRAYAVNFHNAKHEPKIINEFGWGKKREIIVPSFMEQVVHHMIIRQIKPIIMHGMYDHSYGSIPNRGLHGGKNRIRKWLDKDWKNTKYFLKMDITHFFASIPHDKLKTLISSKIKDDDFNKVLFEIIDVQDNGLPLGFLHIAMACQLVSARARPLCQGATARQILYPIHGRYGYFRAEQTEVA